MLVHLSRGADGSRRVVEVATVASSRRESFRLQTLMSFEQEPLDVDRVVRGVFEHLPIPERMARRMTISGEAVPAGFQVQSTASPDHVREVQ